MNAFSQPDRGRLLVTLVNRQSDLPPVPIRRLPLRLRPPAGKRCIRVILVPDGRVLPHVLDADGTICALLPELQNLALVAVEWRSLGGLRKLDGQKASRSRRRKARM